MMFAIRANGTGIYNHEEPYLSNMCRFLQGTEDIRRYRTKGRIITAFLSGMVVGILIVMAV